jgi:hypothetical protein
MHVSLESILANRRWVRRDTPFPHVVAGDVFTPDFYTQLHSEFARVERDNPQVFRRNMAGYDASAADLGNFRDGPFGVFASRKWHDMIAGVAGVSATGDVSGSLHHHEPGGKSGWPHNDLNPGWFAGPPAQPDEVRLSFVDGVSYHGDTRPPGVAARETIRAVSLLFYVGNPDWVPGDGGETGLFANLDTAARGPRAAVPPVNNSLVMFECTPFSWHAFVSNVSNPRNSVVMWLHRRKDEAVARWGEQSIVYW